MAGIGFELRKIFGKKTLLSRTWVIIYASSVSIGPSLMFLILLFSIRALMLGYHATEMETLFFTASFTYAFLIAILISAIMNTVVSRYISDKIFESKEQDICACMFGVLTISSILSGIIAGVLCMMMYLRRDASVEFLVAFYFLTVLAANVYSLIIFVSALKEYKKVTGSYFVGVILTVLLFLFLHRVTELSLISSVFLALVGGFFVILLLLTGIAVKAFGAPNNQYFGFLTYFKKYPSLFFSGILYMFGFYLSNIIYWHFSDIRVKVSVFCVAPNYDMAFFLAILVNLSGMVIFEVKTETSFYEKYIDYLSALGKGTYERIEEKRISLQNTISLQLFFLYEVQLIITIILIFLLNIFYPYLGVSNQILNMLLILGMGVYCILCMYFTIIFLYYFEDYAGACVSTGVFFLVVFLGACICSHLGTPYYTIPVLAGGMTGWVISFIMLRTRVNNLNAYLLCR